MNATDRSDLTCRNLIAFSAERARQPLRKIHRMYQLHLTLARRRLAVGEHPYVRGKTGVVEELIRQRDNGLQPIILEDPPANFALTRPGITREKRRAVENQRHSRAFRFHFGK